MSVCAIFYRLCGKIDCRGEENIPTWLINLFLIKYGYISVSVVGLTGGEAVINRGTLACSNFFQNTFKLAHLLAQAVYTPNQYGVKVSKNFIGKSRLATLFLGYKGKTQIL